MTPKGTVLIIGGAEDKGDGDNDTEKDNKIYKRFDILEELLPKNGGKQQIEIVTTASSIPAEMQKMYIDAFKKLNYKNIGFLDIKDKHEARSLDFCKRIDKAHAVFFSGGDQFKLSGILGGTETIAVLKERYIHDKDFVVAGTSAGAMAISTLMIYEGGVHEAILKDDLKLSSGLGILDGCIIDTHFIKRGRFGRLAHAITMNPQQLGIGLGEDTALIITNGDKAECRGSGMVVIIDGNQIEQTNITEIEDGNPIYVENLKVHLLAKDCKFSIKDRKMLATNLSSTKRKQKALAHG